MTNKIAIRAAGCKAHLVRENKCKSINLSNLKNKSGQQATPVLRKRTGSSPFQSVPPPLSAFQCFLTGILQVFRVSRRAGGITALHGARNASSRFQPRNKPPVTVKGKTAVLSDKLCWTAAKMFSCHAEPFPFACPSLPILSFTQ